MKRSDPPAPELEGSLASAHAGLMTSLNQALHGQGLLMGAFRSSKAFIALGLARHLGLDVDDPPPMPALSSHELLIVEGMAGGFRSRLKHKGNQALVIAWDVIEPYAVVGLANVVDGLDPVDDEAEAANIHDAAALASRPLLASALMPEPPKKKAPKAPKAPKKKADE